MQLQWRIFRSCFSLWLCLMTGALLPSAVMAFSVQVLSSRSGGAYDEVIDALRTETFRGTELRVQYLNTNEPSWKLLESTNLVVAIGVDAANTAIQTADPGTPILCVLIPKVAFEALTGGKKENRKVTAIFLDPPPWPAVRTHSSVATAGQKSRRRFGQCVRQRKGVSSNCCARQRLFLAGRIGSARY